MTSPQSPPRYACGCTHEWLDWVLSVLHIDEEPEWFLQLRENRPRDTWWHVANRQLDYHVYVNGRWRTAVAPLEGGGRPDTGRWEFLDD